MEVFTFSRTTALELLGIHIGTSSSKGRRIRSRTLGEINNSEENASPKKNKVFHKMQKFVHFRAVGHGDSRPDHILSGPAYAVGRVGRKKQEA